MKSVDLSYSEAEDLLDAINVARIDAARMWGQYAATGHADLAADVTGRLDRLTQLRDRFRAVWVDDGPDAERLTLGREEDWREAAEDRMWKLHDEFEGARV